MPIDGEKIENGEQELEYKVAAISGFVCGSGGGIGRIEEGRLTLRTPGPGIQTLDKLLSFV